MKTRKIHETILHVKRHITTSDQFFPFGLKKVKILIDKMTNANNTIKLYYWERHVI